MFRPRALLSVCPFLWYMQAMVRNWLLLIITVWKTVLPLYSIFSLRYNAHESSHQLPVAISGNDESAGERVQGKVNKGGPAWAGIWSGNPGSRGPLQTLTQVLWWSAGAILSRALLDKYESASAPDLLPTGSDSCLLFRSVCSAWWNIIIFITFQTRESSQQVSITLASSNSPFVNISTPLLQLRRSS